MQNALIALHDQWSAMIELLTPPETMLGSVRGFVAWILILTAIGLIRFGVLFLQDGHPVRCYIMGATEMFLQAVKPASPETHQPRSLVTDS